MTDTLQPNVLTVNPDGTIGANLTGHLAAQGVDLPAGQSPLALSNSRLRWLSQLFSDARDIAHLTAYEYPGTRGFQETLAPESAQPTIFAMTDTTAEQQAYVSVGGVLTVILGYLASGPYSDFAAFGVNTASGTSYVSTGAANQSSASSPSIAHGLPRVPTQILISGRDVPGAALWFESFGRTASQFRVFGQYSSATLAPNYQYPFDWLAFC